MSELKTIDKEYIANTYARFPVELVCGKGSLVYDETGKEYIDMGSGIGVTAFGIADRRRRVESGGDRAAGQAPAHVEPLFHGALCHAGEAAL